MTYHAPRPFRQPEYAKRSPAANSIFYGIRAIRRGEYTYAYNLFRQAQDRVWAEKYPRDMVAANRAESLARLAIALNCHTAAA